MAPRAPIFLRLPHELLYKDTSMVLLLMELGGLSRSWARRYLDKFELCPDEWAFLERVLETKKNLWVFRCNQRRFCGDFMVVDMSSPDPALRPLYVVELKRGGELKLGGGGAGNQFSRADFAISELGRTTEIVTPHVESQLVAGSREAVWDYLGVSSLPSSG